MIESTDWVLHHCLISEVWPMILWSILRYDVMCEEGISVLNWGMVRGNYKIKSLDCPLHIFHHRVDITASETKAIQHERCRKTVRVAHFTDDVIQTKKATASFRCSFTFYSTKSKVWFFIFSKLSMKIIEELKIFICLERRYIFT